VAQFFFKQGLTLIKVCSTFLNIREKGMRGKKITDRADEAINAGIRFPRWILREIDHRSDNGRADYLIRILLNKEGFVKPETGRDNHVG